MIVRYVLVLVLWWSACAHAVDVPGEVSFPSLDGKTTLRGFLFLPQTPGPWPAVVMMHGRAGPYSAVARGIYDAATLSMRHKQWGRFWAQHGYLALHVDSYGPRGYAQGFPRHSYSSRPPDVNEQRVRPLDAYAALAWLRRRDDVIVDRIGLQGWSNGAMAGLAAMSSTAPGLSRMDSSAGFRAALLFYPGCRAQAAAGDYRPYAPTLMLVASDDEEVAPLVCRRLAEALHTRGVDDFTLVWYEGATHAFDNPDARRQALAANRRARADSMQRAEEFFARQLGTSGGS